MGSWRFALFLVAVSSAWMIARADAASTRDFGPPEAVAGVRQDLRLLVAVSSEPFRPTIDWVVTDGEDAIAMWHGGPKRGLVALRLRSGPWWWRAEATTKAEAYGAWTRLLTPGIYAGGCETMDEPSPSARDLLSEGFVNEKLAVILSRRLKPEKRADLALVQDCAYALGYATSTVDSYDASFSPNLNDLVTPWIILTGRTPTSSFRDSPADSVTYYAFDLFQSKLKPVAFRAGATIDVWFPYVLNQRVRYVLHLTNVNRQIPPVPGKLENNTLHFTLPAFGLRAGTKAQGEIAKAMP